MTNKIHSSGYVKYDPEDRVNAGSYKVCQAEIDHLKKNRPVDEDNLKGIALSGGGIRAASFSLGVIQSLAKYNKLEQFDFLSTVSGGGYLGGALSWLWSGKWREGTDTKREFGTTSKDFPYGVGGRHSNDDIEMDKDQAMLMRYLRQNGCYLNPGNGLTGLSLLGVILRGMLMGFVALIVLASLLFSLLHLIIEQLPDRFSTLTPIQISLTAMAFYVLSLLFSTLVSPLLTNGSCATTAYRWRRSWEIYISTIMQIIFIIFILSAVFWLNDYITKEIQGVGGVSAVFGAALVWFSQTKDKSKLFNYIPASIIVNVGIFIMLLGLLVLSDRISQIILQQVEMTNSMELFYYQLLIGMLILVLAKVLPINRISIHRYYRDRLMEIFNPDVSDILSSKKTVLASKANTVSLNDCLSPDNSTMPYHIINSNLILVGSKIPKFRGRGGDNFILSPLFSGSNATGWRRSEQFANNSITLPTAVAISGAAANSDSGVAGSGLTIKPLISAIMTIFNLRLGYWVVNPNPEVQPNQKIMPSFLSPGFWGVTGRNKINETSKFIQLSDGGHFENLAMYELIRRHCKLIICSDAEQDNEFSFSSLANIIEKCRVDFGVEIKVSAADLDLLTYSEDVEKNIDFATKGYIVADIIYPGSEPAGRLIYIKTTLTSDIPAELLSYKQSHPTFPDETTADQFFNEKQLEAYRVLGFHFTESLIKDGVLN
ncbi:MAG: patatin-like phospholipase family protein [Gammaproteobacteria bacterium]|nr:patatin-like phospholipase family protein [Gammaproteobacteria bacterium]